VCIVIETDKLCLVMCLVAMSVHGSLSCDVERDALEVWRSWCGRGKFEQWSPERDVLDLRVEVFDCEVFDCEVFDCEG
jgi:hypothetical protein